MKRVYLVIAAILLIGFVVFGTKYIVSEDRQFRIRQIQLQHVNADLMELQLQYDLLNRDLYQEIHRKAIDQQKIRQLQDDKRKLEQRKLELERQLQAKLEAKRVAQARIQEAAQAAARAASFTATASAAKAPKAVPRPANTGSCNQWIAAAGISEVAQAKELIRRESNCNPWAQGSMTRLGRACNVAQELPCGKSGCRLGDGACSVRWMNTYVLNRYGTWANALGHSYAHNWY